MDTEEDFEAELAELVTDPPGGDNGGRRRPMGLVDRRDEPEDGRGGLVGDTWFYRGTDEHGPEEGDVRLPAGHDAKWGSRLARPSLSIRAAQHRELLRAGGFHLEYAEPTGQPNGREPVPITEAVLLALASRITVPPQIRAAAIRPGRKTPEVAAAREQLAREVAGIMDDAAGAGAGKALQVLLGCSRSAADRLTREGRALNREAPDAGM